MRKYQIIIYGSYGFTGKLIADECKAKNLTVLLSGRNKEKLEEQSNETGFAFESVNINDENALRNLLAQASLVIHCGGPFKHTARQMIAACLETKTHYTDITGEYEVFEMLSNCDAQAKERGIVIMPGVGFDVVPSDCLALHLKNKLPDASHLQLSFTFSKGRMSRGTNKTMIESLGHDSMVRRNGKLVAVPIGKDVLDVNYGPFSMKAMCIPWGDIVTGWHSTHIPNIEVYMGVTEKMISSAKVSRMISWFLRLGWVKKYLKKKIDKGPVGPSHENLEKGRSYLWGKAWNEKNESVEARLEVCNGYQLTASTCVLIAEKFLNSEVRTGYFTPAQYFGEGLILEVEGSKYLPEHELR